ncbi:MULTISPECIES: flagellar export protein FliJ [Rhodobacterales]|uniref:flagellar export protein FliJ n=1 Tax=Roseobacter sp. N2S TaxID=2663844 RepID=UPI00285E1872|nr:MULTISPECIES: flagellar export protein FliJ [Rhodobacterales]MDR6266736.1 flagellar export protein FliJ [Roseobacter sp. N2S]
MTGREKTYALLARLHNQEMETQAGTLAALQGEADRLTAERSQLDQSRREGASVTMIEAMPYRGRFLNIVRQENQRLSRLITDVEKRIETQRDKVIDAYREVRSSEKLQADVRTDILRELRQADQAEADEMALLRRFAGPAE